MGVSGNGPIIAQAPRFTRRRRGEAEKDAPGGMAAETKTRRGRITSLLPATVGVAYNVYGSVTVTIFWAQKPS